MKEIFERLKQRLAENKSNFVRHYSWWGDTECGFDEKDEFDFEKLCAEIDAFAEQFSAPQHDNKQEG